MKCKSSLCFDEKRLSNMPTLLTTQLLTIFFISILLLKHNFWGFTLNLSLVGIYYRGRRKVKESKDL